MTTFVKSVEYVEITLAGSTAVSVNLTKSQIFGNCVPFFTSNCNSGVGAKVRDRYVDVFFESGPKVTAKRASSAGTVIVGIFVVEFDVTGDISVQQGTFTIANTATTTTETISTVTDIDKAFCVISHDNDANSFSWLNGETKVNFNSTTELGFSRVGTAGTNSGHYYVVWTTETDFSVQHITMAIANGVETNTDTISTIALDKSFVYNTFETVESSDDVRDAGYVIDLEDATTVRCRRAFNSFGGSPGSTQGTGTVEAQIISAGGSEFSVERAECDWGDNLTQAVTITEIDQTKAIVVPGGYQGLMSADEAAGSDLPGNYAILDFTSNTEVTGTRATNTDPDGTTIFEVVEFVLAGGVVFVDVHGDVDGVGLVEGQLDAQSGFHGSVDGVGLVEGQLDAQPGFHGSVDGVGLVEGSLTISAFVDLHGDVDGLGAVSGSLSLLTGFHGQVISVASVQAILGMDVGFHGKITSISELAAALGVLIGFHGDIPTIVNVDGALANQVGLHGDIDSVAELAAALTLELAAVVPIDITLQIDDRLIYAIRLTDRNTFTIRLGDR